MVQAAAKSKVTGYRDLIVWQKGVELAKAVYSLTHSLPPEEKFRLVSQIRRAAISIPSNVAEGQARKSTAEFIHFISNAEGSVAELDTQLALCVELRLCNPASAEIILELIAELKKMLNALRRSLIRLR